MRIELRVERDDHEYAVSVEADQSVSADCLLTNAVHVIRRVAGIYADGGLVEAPTNPSGR